jgi:hypothetical protein
MRFMFILESQQYFKNLLYNRCDAPDAYIRLIILVKIIQRDIVTRREKPESVIVLKT